MCAAYFVQGVKMSLGTLTESYYMKDDLLFDPPAVRPSPEVLLAPSHTHKLWLVVMLI